METRSAPAATTALTCGDGEGDRCPARRAAGQPQAEGRAGGRPPAFDKAQYHRRSAVERCVNKWKRFRAVATRYDYIFNGTLAVTAIVIWLPDLVQAPSKVALTVEPVVVDRRLGPRMTVEELADQ